MFLSQRECKKLVRLLAIGVRAPHSTALVRDLVHASGCQTMNGNLEPFDNANPGRPS